MDTPQQNQLPPEPPRERLKIAMPWIPICISTVALVVSFASLYVSRQNLLMAKEEFSASRTVILQTSIRPLLDMKDFIRLAESEAVADQAKATEMYRQGFQDGALAFIPSLHPSGIQDLTLYFTPDVNGFKSIELLNVAGGTTRFYREQKLITEPELAAPASFVTPKLSEYLKRITPERHKIGNRTLNRGVIPMVLKLKVILKGRVLHEYQIYWANISYQIAEDGHVLVQNLTIDFDRRAESEREALKYMMERYKDARFAFGKSLPPAKTLAEQFKHESRRADFVPRPGTGR